jgi:hypothetical protein
VDETLLLCDDINKRVSINRRNYVPTRGRALGIKKEVTGQLKNKKKQKGYTEKSRKSNSSTQAPRGEGKVMLKL